ncbi:hypothetical protein [Pseudactinotalea sp. Z1732]|uniref:hypothetical protein n=1 Tax=Micrococcales TaxID=85006 RepID=UPI003C7A1BB3
MLILTWCIIGASLVLAGWAGIRGLRDRPVIFIQLIGGALVVLAIIAQMVVTGIALGSAEHTVDTVLLWGYLITALVLLPAAGWWAVLDRSRWSSVVLVVAAFTIAVLQLRIWQIWVIG